MSEPNQIHELRCWPTFFAEVVAERKRFELRRDDRGFRVGDCLVLCEWNPETERYSGEQYAVRVTYLTREYMPEGYVALSIEPWVKPVCPSCTELAARLAAPEEK